MKQVITITVLILISIIIGCSSNTKASGSVSNSTLVYKDFGCRVYLIKVRGHEYLVSYTGSSNGGTCIIPVAHCPCQTNKNMKQITITDDTYNKLQSVSPTVSSKKELQDVIKSIHEDLDNYFQ